MTSQPSSERIGIVLAGGTGSRLYPLTVPVNKQLLPVYDKPMIYYPLATLMLAGIREIIVISSPEALPQFKTCLGDGAQWGLRLTYVEQPRPEGIPQAFLVAEEHIRGRPVALVLGDNILYGSGLPKRLQEVNRRTEGATIFAYPVSDPSQFGVVTMNEQWKPIALEEKPRNPRSRYAVPGLYFYDEQVVTLAHTLKPSARGELEITELNRLYLECGALNVVVMGRGWAWLDGGTHEALFDAGQFVRVLEERTGLKIGCLEEIALNMGYISPDDVHRAAAKMPNNNYGRYLRALVRQEEKA
jgi:glucose-1-phosphate thymidylyltransferase